MNAKIEERKRKEYLKKQKKNEKRQRELEIEKDYILEEKRRKGAEKQQHCENIRKNIIKNEERRKKEILKKMKETDEMVIKTKAIIEEERKEKNLDNFLRAKDREAAIRKIENLEEYKIDQLLEKIEMDNERAHKLKEEKDVGYENRQRLRKDMVNRRDRINREFDEMVKTGKVNRRKLEKLQQTMNNSATVKLEQRYFSTEAERNNIQQNSFEEFMKRPLSKKEKKRRVNEKEKYPNAIPLKDAIEEVQKLRTDLYNELTIIIEREQEKEDERDELLKNVYITI